MCVYCVQTGPFKPSFLKSGCLRGFDCTHMHSMWKKAEKKAPLYINVICDKCPYVQAETPSPSIFSILYTHTLTHNQWHVCSKCWLGWFRAFPYTYILQYNKHINVRFVPSFQKVSSSSTSTSTSSSLWRKNRPSFPPPFTKWGRKICTL